ncbi:CocE/NonD family hydrolase [Armatimonas sp.]|uniref:CocE/NonD family hydrolase n=1 Tax=Armatimonas sp. TaxID=1872638 RepID=UPI0037510EE5
MRPTRPLAFLALGLAAVSSHTAAPRAATLRQTEQSYTKRDVQIPMRDGTKLYTVIYAPKNETKKHPILMVRKPYTDEGYIQVFQDVRGKYLSEENYENVRPLSRDGKTVDESTDTYDTVAWLLKNIPSNNGKVGLTGVSYPGFYAAVGAVRAHPALKAVSPQAPVTDWFLGDGAFMLVTTPPAKAGGFLGNP